VEKIFSLICSRPAGLCNFLDAPELEAFLGPKGENDERWRVVYRNYATLFFVFVVDGAESELGILDLIQECGSHSRITSFDNFFRQNLGIC
jgi:AP-3 complex subunit sigma